MMHVCTETGRPLATPSPTPELRLYQLPSPPDHSGCIDRARRAGSSKVVSRFPLDSQRIQTLATTARPPPAPL